MDTLTKPVTDTTGSFSNRLKTCGLYPLKAGTVQTLQINVGKKCNQTCRHCHVDAGPHRKEMMDRRTMEMCLKVLAENPIPVVDITGGAPEMHPDFRWFVEQCRALGKKVMVRCNLTIILANKKYFDLPEFYRRHEVEVISSLPFYNADRTDRQRGEGVFEKSIVALQMLNAAGYGLEGSGLTLNLVYNPSGAFLPGPQTELESQFKKVLYSDYNIRFNNLFTITNMPISRFLDYLISSGNYTGYMQKLVEAFNPVAAGNVMCRQTLSVSWDGYLYDCDFNQMLDIKINSTRPHISSWDPEAIDQREIVTNQHCFGCTAGSGSSCGGAIS